MHQLGQEQLDSSSPRVVSLGEPAQSSGHLGKQTEVGHVEARFLHVEGEAIEASSALPRRRRRAGTH